MPLNGLTYCIEATGLLDLPDEIIEDNLMTFLSLKDLYSCNKCGSERLKNCSNRVLHKRTYVAVIGGFHDNYLKDVELILLRPGSICLEKESIPLLPIGLCVLGGVQLPNGDLLVCGGNTVKEGWEYCEGIEAKDGWKNDDYLVLRKMSEEWSSIGKMLEPRSNHSSIFINGSVFSCGGKDSGKNIFAHHEEFKLGVSINVRKELPLKLVGHTVEDLGSSNYILIGGLDKNGRYSPKTYIYNIEADTWNEGPTLLDARNYHTSCAIKSKDGTTRTIIAIGGDTTEEMFSASTEVFEIEENVWSRGPDIPVGLRSAACVAIPSKAGIKYCCLLIGGYSSNEKFSPNIYALDNSLTTWFLIGKLQTGRRNHVALLLNH